MNTPPLNLIFSLPDDHAVSPDTHTSHLYLAPNEGSVLEAEFEEDRPLHCINCPPTVSSLLEPTHYLMILDRVGECSVLGLGSKKLPISRNLVIVGLLLNLNLRVSANPLSPLSPILQIAQSVLSPWRWGILNC